MQTWLLLLLLLTGCVLLLACCPPTEEGDTPRPRAAARPDWRRDGSLSQQGERI